MDHVGDFLEERVAVARVHPRAHAMAVVGAEALPRALYADLVVEESLEPVGPRIAADFQHAIAPVRLPGADHVERMAGCVPELVPELGVRGTVSHHDCLAVALLAPVLRRLTLLQLAVGIDRGVYAHLPQLLHARDQALAPAHRRIGLVFGIEAVVSAHAPRVELHVVEAVALRALAERFELRVRPDDLVVLLL